MDRDLPRTTSLVSDLRPVLPWIGLAAAVAVLEVVLYAVLDIPPRTLLYDPAELARELPSLPSYGGALTALAVVCWFSAAALLWFGAWLVRPDHPLRTPMIALGVFSGLLGLDDRLRIHEDLSQALGTSEAVVFAVYGVLLLVILWRYGDRLRPERGFGLVAGIGFAVSLAIDVIVEGILHLLVSGEAFLEENAKLMGVIVWVGLAAHLARRAVRTDAAEPSVRS